MNNCEQLLIESIKIYQLIDNYYDNMLQMPLGTADPNQLNKQSQLIASCSEQLLKIDEQLKALVPELQLRTENTKLLVDKRKQLIKELINKNNTISQKASNISSALKHEFSNLAKNQSAINRYGQSMPTQKRSMLNNSY